MSTQKLWLPPKAPLEPDWERFYGCNHERFPQADYRRGGGYRFSDFINRHLSDDIWKLLVEVLHPMSLWIIRPNESEWTIGRMSGAMTIRLDENELIRDVEITP